ncbi:hypothetical protein FKW77_007409 [Venturia effusa]|uniref:Uncharacterized protein n=1 Tax=Venturia effusa TaxID=50376 RepID=A0A517LLS9_9PEZI|nr:hypothetical protein FKW77_007409 [Venturia effusa]
MQREVIKTGSNSGNFVNHQLQQSVFDQSLPHFRPGQNFVMLFFQTLVAALLSATALAMPGDWQKEHEYEKSVCKTKTAYDYETYTDKAYKTVTNYKTDVETKYKTDVYTKYKTEVQTILETKTYPYEEKTTKPFYETKTVPYPSTITEYKPATKTKEKYVTVCKTKWEGDHYG